MSRDRPKGSGNKPDVNVDPAFATIQRYLNDISDLPLISAEEEIKLARKIREGDIKARAKLVEANLRFVVSVAHEYQNRGVPLADLISSGNIGLITAAERFDETRGFRFISYAVWWIRQAIRQNLSERARVVHLPLNQIDLLRHISRFSGDRQQITEELPTEEEIAEEMGVSVKHVKDVLVSGQRTLSLDATLGVDNDNTLMETLADDRQEPADALLQRSFLEKDIKLALSKLKDREAEVIRLYFGLGGGHNMTLAEIGVKLGLSRERVRQIKKKALQKLCHPRRGAMIRAYAKEDGLIPSGKPMRAKRNCHRVYNRSDSMESTNLPKP